MSVRFISLTAALLVASALAAVPAGAHGAANSTAPAVTAAQAPCGDLFAPSSRFTGRQLRVAKRTGVLRGTAYDVGCGVNRVMVSIARKLGRGCRNLSVTSRFSRRTTCKRMNWIQAVGASSWSITLPRLRRGTYIVRSQAIDNAGNAQKPRARRMKVR
jgi:hypothetical protein